MQFRSMMAIMLVATITSCGQYGASGPNDLGLFQRFDAAALPVSLNVTPSSPEVQRNQELSKWIIRSDYLCNNYLLRISRAIRDSRLATDSVATVLTGLATILTPVQTKTALSGAATMVLGIGGDIQTDVFSEQASDVVSSAIQTVRTRARTALQQKMQARYATYTLEQGLVDVQRYDQETCNLNVGLNELRTSLITGPKGERSSNPILPLSEPLPTQLVQPPGIVQQVTPATTLATGRASGAPTGTAPRINGRGRLETKAIIPPSEQIAEAIGEEKNIAKEIGRRIQRGLCLVPDAASVSFGPTTRGAIVLFRQTSAAKNLPGARSSGGLSAEEASYLANKQCDLVRQSDGQACYRNAYEYYQFGVNTPNKNKSLQELADRLRKAAPALQVPSNLAELCDLRPAITQVQTTIDKFSKWKDLNGTLDVEFVSTLPTLDRPGD